jgi:MFS family permease
LKALFVAYTLQIVGIILPAIDNSLPTIMFSVLLFGGTFIACVSLVLTMAGKFYPSNPAKFMGTMTLAYSIAQIMAPVFTGYLAETFGNYNLGLYFSAGVMLIGSAVLLALLRIESTSAEKTTKQKIEKVLV